MLADTICKPSRSTYRPEISASVFVTTEKVAKKQKNNITSGEWFELHEYKNKGEFLQAALNYAVKELGEETPILYFAEVEAGFDEADLFSKKCISAEVWDIMDMEQHVVEMMQAYKELYPQPKDARILDIVEKARSQYCGYFYDTEDFVYDYLETNEHLQTFPNLFYFIKVDKLAAQLMTERKELEGHYFHN